MLPVSEPSAKGGRPRGDRICFNAIVFVLFTGIAWRHLAAGVADHVWSLEEIAALLD